MADKFVNGRRAILQCLDTLLAEENNIKLYKEAFQTQIDTEPMKFFQNVILPLMPKDGLAMTDPDDEKKQSQLTIQFIPAPVPVQPKE